MGRVFNRFSHDFQTIDKEVRYANECIRIAHTSHVCTYIDHHGRTRTPTRAGDGGHRALRGHVPLPRGRRGRRPPDHPLHGARAGASFFPSPTCLCLQRPSFFHPQNTRLPNTHPINHQAVILPLAFGVARTFLALSTPLKRLESAARSPLYAHFTESIAGLVVLRAYRAEPLFLSRLHHDVDEADRMHFVMWIANYYMSMRLRLLGATVAGVTALAVVLKVRA